MWCAARADEPRKHTVRGRDLIQAGPRGVEVASVEIHAALMDPLMAIANVVSEVLEATPPKLAGDLIDSGMVLTGGGCSRASTRCSQNARGSLY